MTVYFTDKLENAYDSDIYTVKQSILEKFFSSEIKYQTKCIVIIFNLSLDTMMKTQWYKM